MIVEEVKKDKFNLYDLVYPVGEVDSEKWIEGMIFKIYDNELEIFTNNNDKIMVYKCNVAPVLTCPPDEK